MNIKQAIAHVVDGHDLTTQQMHKVMTEVMTGQATDAQISGLLVGLRMKGEIVDELVGAAEVMRSLVQPVHLDLPDLIDTCGTGGDGSNIFNVSTAAAFVVAAVGGHVAKHGNRSVSSKTGSADVLEAAGIKLDLTPDQVARSIEHVGVGFMFAPAHHSAMKYAVGPRKELGVRTLFNLVGPLVNPAAVKRQVMGVFARQWVKPVATVLQRLGSEHVMVVHAEDGLDEVSIAADTWVAELKNGEIHEYRLSPEQFSIKRQSLSGLKVDSAENSIELIRDALGKQTTENSAKAADMIAINAGAAIYVTGLASNIEQGVAMAQDAVASGLAKEKISELASFTRYATQVDE
ncbi:anthranilate phosphoribosyltransferase [Zooshikella ganghwensis]|uniref:anthranilate phosphoribosyltransferase n=1 Tax=Zooshikella ganghwensis TaxID=202772 RepID=UPI000406EB46|nr:anthranilate phosphoribosyltransferase [Zooshikella ganghwensis]